MVRIQFDIDDSLWERALPYVENKKNRAFFGRQAFTEWVNRREARDKRSIDENDLRLKKMILKAIRELKENGKI